MQGADLDVCSWARMQSGRSRRIFLSQENGWGEFHQILWKKRGPLQLSSSESLPDADKDGLRLLLPLQPTCCWPLPARGTPGPPLPPAASGGRHPPIAFFLPRLGPRIYLHVVTSHPAEVLLKSLPQTREPTCQTDLPLPQPMGTLLQN